jgi:hypothetical protein
VSKGKLKLEHCKSDDQVETIRVFKKLRSLMGIELLTDKKKVVS